MRSGSDFFQMFARAVAAKGGAKFLPEPVNFRFPHIAQTLLSHLQDGHKMLTQDRV